MVRLPDTRRPFFPPADASVCVIAHRGGSLEAPENTCAALRRSIGLGSHWQEIDVGLSADGVAVVLHDDTLLRTASAQGALADLPAAEVLAHRAGTPTPSGDTLLAMSRQGITRAPVFVDDGVAEVNIPSLRQALCLPKTRWMLELKKTARPQALVQAVLSDVEATQSADRVALASFETELLLDAHARAPHVPLIGVAETIAEARMMLTLPISALAVSALLVAEIYAATPPQVALWCWTVYTAAQAERLRAQGVDGVITDVPAAVLAAMASPQKSF